MNAKEPTERRPPFYIANIAAISRLMARNNSHGRTDNIARGQLN